MPSLVAAPIAYLVLLVLLGEGPDIVAARIQVEAEGLDFEIMTSSKAASRENQGECCEDRNECTRGLRGSRMGSGARHGATKMTARTR